MKDAEILRWCKGTISRRESGNLLEIHLGTSNERRSKFLNSIEMFFEVLQLLEFHTKWSVKFTHQTMLFVIEHVQSVLNMHERNHSIFEQQTYFQIITSKNRRRS